MRAVILLSGGMDSATLLAEILHGSVWHSDSRPVTVTFQYGQRHFRETSAAERLADHYKVGLNLIRIDHRAFYGSSQTGSTLHSSTSHGKVPHGHYTDESMKVTVVPNRNLAFLSVAAAWAVGRGYDTVCYAAHAGDHAIYPDCRPEFIEAATAALQYGCGVYLHAPFQSLTKTEICQRGAELGVPFNLTYSCYEGDIEHCGECGTCVERQEAFIQAGVLDPTKYKKRTFLSEKRSS